MSRRYFALALLVGLGSAGCQKKTQTRFQVPEAAVTRGDLAVRVQATGTVETIDPVEIKSKAGGAITQLPVEVGSKVKAKSLLAQIDPRDVQNKFNQAVADDVVAFTTLQRVLRDQARKDTLYALKMIPRSTQDSSISTVRSAQSDMLTARSALDLARQSLEDASIESPLTGTVVSRPVSLGTIITPATGQATGTTLMNVADLTTVRMRVTIDEVEMGNVHVGQFASVAVDAFPDRTFNGRIEKVEPQAVLTQGVTFFPVLITIENPEELLLPGMSGEVTIRAGDLKDVLRVPIDAVRETNELAPIARLFGVPVDSIISQMRPDLISVEGATAIPGNYVVVQQPDSSYEMRLVKVGPADVDTREILDGVKEGEKVVMLGTVVMERPANPPKITLGEGLRRGTVAANTPRKNSSTSDKSTATKSPEPTPAGSPKGSGKDTTPKAEVAKAPSGSPGKP